MGYIIQAVTTWQQNQKAPQLSYKIYAHMWEKNWLLLTLRGDVKEKGGTLGFWGGLVGGLYQYTEGLIPSAAVQNLYMYVCFNGHALSSELILS